MSSDSDRPKGVDDFVKQLRLSVHEEAPLWEVPLGATEHGERTVTHGPWDGSACSYALGRWLEHGLMGLYRLRPNELPLDLRPMKPAGF